MALARVYAGRSAEGDREHARQALRAAIAIYENLEAPLSLQAAQEALGALGTE